MYICYAIVLMLCCVMCAIVIRQLPLMYAPPSDMSYAMSLNLTPVCYLLLLDFLLLTSILVERIEYE